MKISTKGRYALRLMLDIAMNDTGQPVPVKDIAGRQDISEKYLEQIISMLNKGAQGGYLLTRTPSEYTVGMILRLAEGSLAPATCIEEGESVCERSQSCVSAMLWRKVNDAVNGVIDETTLQDLIDWQKSKV